MEWTDEMLATAAGMRRAGIPYKAIAKRLGVTCKALEGKIKKLGAYAKLNHKNGVKANNTIRGRLTHCETPNIEEALL